MAAVRRIDSAMRLLYMNGPVPGTPSDFYARNLPTEQSRESREKLWSRGMPDRLDGGIQAMHRWGLAGGQLTGCFGPLYVALYSAPPPSTQSPR